MYRTLVLAALNVALPFAGAHDVGVAAALVAIVVINSSRRASAAPALSR